MLMYLKFNKTEPPQQYLSKEFEADVELESINEDLYTVVNKDGDNVGILESVEDSYYYWGD